MHTWQIVDKKLRPEFLVEAPTYEHALAKLEKWQLDYGWDAYRTNRSDFQSQQEK